MTETLFTKIIQGKIPCHKLLEDEHYFAFLDIRPIAEGHSLLIPKEPIDYLFELEEEVLSGLLPAAKPLAKALEKVFPCERIGIMVAGLEVPHAHLHLVPIQGIGDLNFANAKNASDQHLAKQAELIRAELSN